MSWLLVLGLPACTFIAGLIFGKFLYGQELGRLYRRIEAYKCCLDATRHDMRELLKASDEMERLFNDYRDSVESLAAVEGGKVRSC